MSKIIEQLERAQLRDGIPKFKAGDTVRVHWQVVEGERRRPQVFQGVVIKRQGSGVRETFTVRKLSFGVGVERTFPLHSPKIDKIEVAAVGDVNRAKLYYLRGRVGKRARIREIRQDKKVVDSLDATAEPPPAATEPADLEQPETEPQGSTEATLEPDAELAETEPTEPAEPAEVR